MIQAEFLTAILAGEFRPEALFGPRDLTFSTGRTLAAFAVRWLDLRAARRLREVGVHVVVWRKGRGLMSAPRYPADPGKTMGTF
jgi:hypothetical protein